MAASEHRRSEIAFAVVTSVVWAAGAFAFSLWRTPYDDEWFSLTLAANTDWPHFWRSLDADMHPPWVALLDRAMMPLGWRWPIHAVHVSASAVAIGLVIRTFRERLTIPRTAFVLAAFHPVVFMYGAAARWYPFLFLAQALRLWALFRPGLGRRARGAAFGLGALLGSAAGYIDLLFVAIDSAFFIRWRPKDERLPWAAAVVTVAGIAIAAMTLLSPLDHHLQRLLIRRPGASPFSVGMATWAVFGLTGDALPPGRLAVLAALVLPAFVVGVARWVSVEWKHGMGVWGVLTGLAWLLACVFGVWHPRYSLLPMFIATVTIGLVAVWNRWGRAFAIAGALYIPLATTLALKQRFFVKSDLNDLDPSFCRELLQSQPHDLIVAPYPRTRLQLERNCNLTSPVTDVPWYRHYPRADEQLASLKVALAGTRRVLLVSIPAKKSLLEVTNDRARAVLASRCVLQDDRRVGTDPFYNLKRRFLPSETSWRYRAEEWICQDENDASHSSR